MTQRRIRPHPAFGDPSALLEPFLGHVWMVMLSNPGQTQGQDPERKRHRDPLPQVAVPREIFRDVSGVTRVGRWIPTTWS